MRNYDDLNVPLISNNRELSDSGFCDDVREDKVHKQWTVDQFLSHIGMGRFHYLLYVILGTGFMSNAMGIMLSSFLTPSLQCEWDLTFAETSWTNTCIYIGMLIGAYTLGIVSDIYGRKKSFFLSMLAISISNLTTALSPNYPVLLASRVMVGFGLGGASIIFSFFSEMVPLEQRGPHLMLFQQLWSVGSVLQCLIAWIILPKFGWRIFTLISSLPPIFLCFSYFWICESPRYLVVHGRYKEALAVLFKIATLNNKPHLEAKLKQTEFDIEKYESDDFTKFKDQFKIKMLGMFTEQMTRLTLIMWFLWFCCGLAYYSVISISSNIHIDFSKDKNKTCSAESNLIFSSDEYQSITLDTLAEVPALILAFILIEFTARKNLLFCGWVLATATMIILTVTDSYYTMLLFVSRLFVDLSFSVIYIYTPEAFPSHIRSFAVGTCSIFEKLGGILSSFLSLQLLQLLNTRLIFCILTLTFACASISALFLPFDTRRQPMN